ncbi:MAG TPA: hypothetical protein VNO52_07400 [Methylomirabilota bacterium]|nr:hypothetical protein [Methylomirabilota bacterium]
MIRPGGDPLLRLTALAVALAVMTGCASRRAIVPETRRFTFGTDTFAFTNQLVWEYRMDPATGRMTHARREPPPDYAHHCFVLARAAAQFYTHARFEPGRPPLGQEGYRRLVRRVCSTSLRRDAPPEQAILIPGYSNLFAFSREHEALLKAECGGAWQSYCQRGHWRMVFPLSRAHQERMSRQLATQVAAGRVAVVHVVRFPSLSINHALVCYAAQQTPERIVFLTYDPNIATRPTELVYDRTERRFQLAPNHYFAGGRVDVYQVHHAWNY